MIRQKYPYKETPLRLLRLNANRMTVIISRIRAYLTLGIHHNQHAVAGASVREGMPATHGNSDASANLPVQSRESRKSRRGETVIGDLGVQPEGDRAPAPLGKVRRYGPPCPKCSDTWQWPTSRGGWVCSGCICAAPGPVQIATPGGDIMEAGGEPKADPARRRPVR